MLGFVKDQQHLALAEIETQIAQNPIDGTHADCPTALGYPLHQVQGVDSLANIDVVSSPAFTVLGDLRAVQFRDQVLQYIGLLGSRGAVEVYKRLSLVAYTFPVTHFESIFRRTDFFNSYSPYRK